MREPEANYDVDMLGNIVERTQEATNQALTYAKSHHSKWERLKAHTKRLEDNVRDAWGQAQRGEQQMGSN